MKKIGIIGAMMEEVAILQAKLENLQQEKIAGVTFYKGQLSNKEIILLQSGIGKVNAAIGTALLCDKYQPELIINTGSAGGLDPDLNTSDIIISDKVVYGDVDVTAFDYKFGQVPQMPLFYQGDKEIAKKTETIYKERLTNTENKVVNGLIVTTDSFLCKREQLTSIRKHFKEAKAAEMEAAAIAQTAYHFGIPFVVIRAISDGADEEASVSFNSFLEEVVKRGSDCVTALIEKL